ncbi:hypothetical protein DVH24_027705 [Malus domestica]|uniref:Uncharacterized protein n=1 Tax=Malus domestica TaxID=3750 RepID=A0A498H844_MALDO|nr:hypothetical protein DVH24_027705 [Malus domestica]
MQLQIVNLQKELEKVACKCHRLLPLYCLLGCVWYVGRDGTERNEAFRPAFGALKMGGTGCSTGQILGVFAFHLSPLERTNIPHVFFKNYTFVPSRPVPFRSVPSAYQTHPMEHVFLSVVDVTVARGENFTLQLKLLSSQNYGNAIRKHFSSVKTD